MAYVNTIGLPRDANDRNIDLTKITAENERYGGILKRYKELLATPEASAELLNATRKMTRINDTVDMSDIEYLGQAIPFDEKLSLAIHYGVNMLILYPEENRAYYTRIFDTNSTICLLQRNGMHQTGLWFHEENENEDALSFTLIHIEADKDDIGALFAGECIDQMNVKLLQDNQWLPHIIDNEYDFTTMQVHQRIMNIDTAIEDMRNESDVLNDIVRIKVNTELNNIFPPRPQHVEVNLDDDIKGKYAAGSIKLFNEHHNDNCVDIPCEVKSDGLEVKITKAGRYFYMMNHSGNQIVNNRIINDDNEEKYLLAPLYGSAPRKVMSSQIKTSDAVVCVHRVYMQKATSAISDILLTISAVLSNDGKVSKVIATTTFIERVAQSMLVNSIYHYDRMRNKLEFISSDNPFGETNKYDIILDKVYDGIIEAAIINGCIDLERLIKRKADAIIDDNLPQNARMMKRGLDIVYGRDDKISKSKVMISTALFEYHKPTYSVSLYGSREQFYDQVHPFIRDSLTPRLTRRLQSVREEQLLPESEVKRICASYTTECRDIGKFEVKGKCVVLPCGFVTTIRNQLLHKHACTLKMHAATRDGYGRTLIHSSFKCHKCGSVYNSNVLAYMCSNSHV